MPSYRTRTVAEVLGGRRGLQRVRLDDASRAFVLTALVGEVAVGDEVVVNTTAVDLGLGTGGWHVVHWNLSRRELDLPGGGHIMKLRYTSLQIDTGAAEEPAAGVADEAAQFDVVPPSLGGVPVLIGTLHSQVGVAAVAVKSVDPTLRLVYVMTDGAALPLALSDLVADLCDRRLLDATVTAGHAFGGDLEAVGVASAVAPRSQPARCGRGHRGDGSRRGRHGQCARHDGAGDGVGRRPRRRPRRPAVGDGQGEWGRRTSAPSRHQPPHADGPGAVPHGVHRGAADRPWRRRAGRRHPGTAPRRTRSRCPIQPRCSTPRASV